MLKRYSLLGVLLLSMILFSCKEDEPTVCPPNPEPQDQLRISVQPTFGASTLYLDSVVTTQEGYNLKFTDIKFYMQDVRNGSNQMLDAGLFDYRERGTVLLQTFGEKNNYSSLQANLGVDAAINHNDPSAFPNESMLNIVNSNDMHWGWSPGYIFVKIEGKADTINDAIDLFDHNIVFHTGLDVNLQSLDFSNLIWQDQGSGVYELQMKLDMATFLQGSSQSIDVQTEYSTHSAVGQEVLTLKVMQNFKEALTLY